ncbi:MAG: HAD family hydrolase [Nitrospirae bacterium]|nr:HAD family hydrolase [Candidatus Manganitrophaceae bacterium]
MNRPTQKPSKKSFLIDMDGVLVRGPNLIPGADVFIQRLKEEGRKFLVLTNNSLRTPKDLEHRLQKIGLPVSAEHIYTSALATARFLHSQRPKGTAFVIGESGLMEALHDVEYVVTDLQPDYVVVGDTDYYDHRRITQAVRLVHNGARLIATNPDVTGPSESGIVPATGALVALIEKATGHQAYFVGKPNPLMMRTALHQIQEHSENAVMVGDRMDTDMVAGIESGLETILVLTGVTRREDVDRYPYRPARIAESVSAIEL